MKNKLNKKIKKIIILKCYLLCILFNILIIGCTVYNPKLFSIIKDNDTQKAKKYISKFNANSRGPDGITPLMIAAKNGNLDICQILIKMKADVNAKDKNGITPLLYAAEGGNLEICKLLLLNGANINDSDKKSEHVLIKVAKSKNANINLFNYLISKGAKVDIKTFLSAFESEDIEICVFLIKNKYFKEKDFDKIEKYTHYSMKGIFGTLLISAIERKPPNIVKELLVLGADPNCVKDGLSALHHAVINKSKEKCNLLIDKGAIIDKEDEDGVTPLMLAAYNRSQEIYDLLISKGAKEDKRDKFNWSVIEWSKGFINTKSPIKSVNFDKVNEKVKGFGAEKIYAGIGLAIRAKEIIDTIPVERTVDVCYAYHPQITTLCLAPAKEKRIEYLTSKRYVREEFLISGDGLKYFFDTYSRKLRKKLIVE